MSRRLPSLASFTVASPGSSFRSQRRLGNINAVLGRDVKRGADVSPTGQRADQANQRLEPPRDDADNHYFPSSASRLPPRGTPVAPGRAAVNVPNGSQDDVREAQGRRRRWRWVGADAVRGQSEVGASAR